MIIPRARKKRIEVALLLRVTNKAAVREASVRLGHPSTLLLWRARPPLAAARAVVLQQTVDAGSEVADVPPQEEPRDPRRRPNPVETLINKRMLLVESRAADIDVAKYPS
ncbi:MAG: DUF1156 domain-containing protein [Bryobacterales bacterium]|nr:DUF1156 domain-containing protein [Bryobacterales bacterium]